MTSKGKGMKRKGNLFNSVCSMENLRLADQKARLGKKDCYGIRLFDSDREANLSELRDMLLYKEYTTSKYSIFTIHDPKEREVFRLPYYPDRIVHHAIMNITGPILESHFTANTYACIKGRGIHKALQALTKALRDVPGTQYCLKIDIKKFYPSIDHAIMKAQLRRKIKDNDLLWLLDDIIDSAPGLPIGNYLSQTLSNFYLSPFDHWIKEQKRVPYYFRYADDIVILADSKKKLHQLLAEIRTYLAENLNLKINRNYQVFPVESRGIDFLGYVSYHNYIRIRPSIKKRFAKKVAKGCRLPVIASYYGWAKHANSNHLLKKLLYDNQKLQGLQYQAEDQRVFWSKNRDHRRDQQANSDRGLPRGALETQEGRDVPVPANSV